MIFVVLTLLAGCVPSLLVFFWLRGYLHKGDALFTFGTYALSEELAKFYMFRRRLKIKGGLLDTFECNMG